MAHLLIVDDEPTLCSFYQMTVNEMASYDRTFQSDIAYNILQAEQAIENYLSTGKSYDIVLLDIRLKDKTTKVVGDGESLGVSIRKHMPLAHIIVITSIDSRFKFHSIFQNVRPEGFIIKYELFPDQLVQCIHDVLEGKKFYSETVNSYLADEVSAAVKLEARDRKLLHYLSYGITTNEIAKNLHLSPSGVEKRKRNLAGMIGLDNAKTSSLLKWARENEIL